MNYIVAGFAKSVKIPDKSPPRSVPEFAAKRDMENAVARRAQFRSQWADYWRRGNYIANISSAPPLLSAVEQHHFHAGALQRYQNM
jgi:muconolactone delta-isomerase